MITINANLLKGEIKKAGLTHAEVAKAIGMSECTFSRKINKGKFGVDEADRLIRLLHIHDPCNIFFG